MPAMPKPFVGYSTEKSMPSSSRRSYMNRGITAVARSVVLAAGVPHHADWGVPVARRVSVSASRMRAIGDGWFR